MHSSSIIGFVLLSVVVTAFCKDPVKFEKCDKSASYEGEVTEIDTSAKVSGGIVMLQRGTSVTVSFPFKMDKGSASNITAVVHGVIAGVPVPFPIPNPDGCKDSGLNCPVKSPLNYVYKTVIAVKKDYPNLRLAVKWELKDQSNNDIWCVEIPAQITA